MTFPLDRLRADTPSCLSHVHLNNAGASPTPEPVHRAVLRHLELERRIGGYAAQDAAEAELAAFPAEAAALIGAEGPDEIAFAENATRAWDMAFYGLPLKSGDRVIVHASDYASNHLAIVQRAARDGIAIDAAPSDAFGQVDAEAVARLIGPRTRLIALTHCPSQSGLINPAAAIGRIAREAGVPFLLDACQSVGQLDVDVRDIGCDMLCATGRKFLRGPRGTGFLYVRRSFLESLDPPFADLHSAALDPDGSLVFARGARRFETWERNVAGVIGLAEAIRYARAIGLPAIEARVRGLAAGLRSALTETPGFDCLDVGAELSGIVTFRHRRESPADTAARLRRAGIHVSVAVPAHAPPDFAERIGAPVVRASVHCFNDEDDLERLMTALSEA